MIDFFECDGSELKTEKSAIKDFAAKDMQMGIFSESYRTRLARSMLSTFLGYLASQLTKEGNKWSYSLGVSSALALFTEDPFSLCM